MKPTNLTQVELFSGCGGLALGLAKAGFVTLAHVEKDENASSTFQYNFTRLHKRSIRSAGDITSIESPAGFLSGLPSNGIDLLAGGPPCQAYSRAGRGKLASLAGAKNAHLDDSRGQLYKNYLHFVRDLQPNVVLMENVPDIMNYGGENLADVISEDLDGLGYEPRYTVLNAAAFGVPQYRERWFLLAYRRVLGVRPKFPVPTHSLGGFQETAFSPMLTLRKHIEGGSKYAVLPESSPPNSPSREVTVGEAIADLPITSAYYFSPDVGNRAPFRLCKYTNDALPYASPVRTNFQREMRSWMGPTHELVTANTFRQTERDFPIFARMKPDDRYSVALEIATSLLIEKAQKKGLSARSLSTLRGYAADWVQDLSPSERSRIVKTPEGKLLADTVPPYDSSQFLDKWRVLNPLLPSHTVVAHLSVDTYSHIHFDQAQARAVTVREAARLQSFPDGFLFPGNMGSSFKQIGNAVPPLLAYAIGSEITRTLGRDPKE